MKHIHQNTMLVLVSAFSLTFSAICPAAEEITESGFLSDYSLLTPVKTEAGTDYMYVPTGTFKKIAKYNSVMVDQPEIFISPDSKSKGAKPDTLKAIADAMRTAVTDGLVSGGYKMVEQPGPDVLYIRMALSNLYLKKKKRRLLAYTPIGVVVHAGKQAVIQDAMKKIDIIEMSLEVEYVDSESSEIVAASVLQHGARKDKAKGQKEQRINFENFKAIFDAYGYRMRCRLDNAKLPEADWVDCLDPTAQPAG